MQHACWVDGDWWSKGRNLSWGSHWYCGPSPLLCSGKARFTCSSLPFLYILKKIINHCDGSVWLYKPQNLLSCHVLWVIDLPELIRLPISMYRYTFLYRITVVSSWNVLLLAVYLELSALEGTWCSFWWPKAWNSLFVTRVSTMDRSANSGHMPSSSARPQSWVSEILQPSCQTCLPAIEKHCMASVVVSNFVKNFGVVVRD